MGLPDEHLNEAKIRSYSHLKTIASGKFEEHRMEVARQSMLGGFLRREMGVLVPDTVLPVPLFKGDVRQEFVLR